MPTHFRKVIRIRAEDSPNVKFALLQISRGLEPTGEELVPGVLSYAEYMHRRATWDPIRQCIGLDAEFYEGEQLLMFPPDWRSRAEKVADRLKGVKRIAKALGVDPAEGGDSSCWTVGDELGIIKQISMKTPNTNVVPNMTKILIKDYDIPYDRVLFDRGGGGKEHTDRLEAEGFKGVRSVGFGEAVVLEPKRGIHTFDKRVDAKEEGYAYLNRRAQMYHEASMLIDPDKNPTGFGIPAEYTELMRQLAVIPKWYDKEQRLYLPPKQRKTEDRLKPEDNKPTLTQMIGCSPDEADSFVLMVHAMLHKGTRSQAGAA